MDKCVKVAALYIATLKASSLIHQHSHWTTRGDTFYGHHLLFMRIYEDSLKLLDEAAEKFIGLCGDQCVSYDLQADLLHKLLLKYKDFEGSPARMSLAIVEDFIKFSKDAYKCFEEEGKLTLGLDDMIMAIASKHEEFAYLLQQTLEK